MTRRLIPLVCLSALALAGCNSNPHEDLRAWMAEQRASMHPHVTPIEPPRPYLPASYAHVGETDPFAAAKLVIGAQQEIDRLSPEVAAQMKRPKQPLEQYPLDQIEMVGTITSSGQRFALLKAGKMLYRARVGEYAGQNFGRITAITENEVDLLELAQDATGDWVQRKATLQLQESSQ